ncbi:MAG: hypothetical protein R2710_20100 [Acidimicrobiales bacterium]
MQRRHQRNEYGIDIGGQRSANHGSLVDRQVFRPARRLLHVLDQKGLAVGAGDLEAGAATGRDGEASHRRGVGHDGGTAPCRQRLVDDEAGVVGEVGDLVDEDDTRLTEELVEIVVGTRRRGSASSVRFRGRAP